MPIFDDEGASGVVALIAVKPRAAIDTEDGLGFFWGKKTITVLVVAQVDLDVVRGRGVCRNCEVNVASESGPVRDGGTD